MHAHAWEALIHCLSSQDLKSPNILLAGQKLTPFVLNAKIADVGLSRMANNGYLSHVSKASLLLCSA